MTPQTEPTPDATKTVETESVLDQTIAATSARAAGTRQKAAAFLGCDPSRIGEVLRGVWTTTKGTPPLTDQELIVGIALIARYDLDPFSREIYVTRGKKGLMVIVGIDGWVRVLDRTDHYDGYDQLIQEDDKGNVTSVETMIYSKRRKHPAIYKAYMSEYMKLGGFMAEKIPLHMLRIFSFKHAARMFVPLGGAVTEEEAEWMGAPVEQTEAMEVPAKTLDDLTEQMGKAEPPPVPPTEADPRFTPPTEEEVAADQAQLADEFAGELAKAETASRVAELAKGIGFAVQAYTLSAKHGLHLHELIMAAQERLCEVKG